MRLTLIRLGGFAALGLCLLLVKSWWQPAPERPAIQLSAERLQAGEHRWLQRWGRPPDADERANIIRDEANEEVLFQEALRMGLHRRDPVVMMRLVQNMRFVGGDAEREYAQQRLLEEAYGLNMHLTDIVVRRRLVQVLYERMLRAATPAEPTPGQVFEHIEAHPQRFQSPPLISFSHVYLSPKRPGWTPVSAVQLLDKLRSERISPQEAKKLGDPLPIARGFADQTVHEIGKRFGPKLGPALLDAELGAWSGPYRTSLGQHLIWVEDIEPARTVLDENTLAKARRELLQRDKERMVGEALAKLRGEYQVDVRVGNQIGAGGNVKAG